MDTYTSTSECFALEIDTCTVLDNKGTLQLQTVTICNVKSFRSKCLSCGEIFPPDLSVLLHMQTHTQANRNVKVTAPTMDPQLGESEPVVGPQHVDQYTMTSKPWIAPGPSEHYVVYEVQNGQEKIPVEISEALEDTLEDLPSDDENSEAKSRGHSDNGGQTTPIRKHQCNQCAYAFPTRTKLKIHSRTHSGERPFTCPACEKRFTTRGELTVHSRTHTGVRPYKCPKCDSTHKTRSGRQCHLARHHQEKAYSCEICNRKFAVKHYFTAHMRIHDDTNPIKCMRCGKSFAYKSSLNKHEKRNNCSESSAVDMKGCRRTMQADSNMDSNDQENKGDVPTASDHRISESTQTDIDADFTEHGTTVGIPTAIQ